jgi:hypothetical protein
MMTNFLEWFSRNRTMIGYTVGGLNVVNGIASVSVGDTWTGIFFIVIGSAIIFDAKVFK